MHEVPLQAALSSCNIGEWGRTDCEISEALEGFIDAQWSLLILLSHAS